MAASPGGGNNPNPGVPDSPNVKPPGGTGTYRCPFACYRRGNLITEAKDGACALYARGSEAIVEFEYALEDFLGNVFWRNWDGRLSKYDIDTHRRCRGNGYVDLDATMMQSDAYVLSGAYDVVKMQPPGIFDSPRYYLHLMDGVYVDLAEVTAYRSYGMVIGFWTDSKSPQLPTDFTRFNRHNCPVQTVIVIPSL